MSRESHRDSETEIEAEYRARTPRSSALAARAAGSMPSGIVHDSRHIRPYGLFASHAEGAHKWDVDGNRYIDFFGGHGALLLGHNRPEVVRAVAGQLARGTHFAMRSELEIDWAEAIRRMVPSAERVRFHASGSEATQMAVRLARAHTGRPRLLRFHGHYHGWQDDMTTGYAAHFDGSPPAGVPAAVAAQSLALDPFDADALAAALAPGTDIAAVILEPLGAMTGKVALPEGFLARLRALTEASGTVLIFDEVITGFRVSPGGVQAVAGVVPDLTTLAKIVAGGLPGGAVAGAARIMDGLDFEASARAGREKIYHPGTFNACPLSAAAGIAALSIIERTDACARADRLAARLRAGLGAAVAARGLGWEVHGVSSAFHIGMGALPVDRTAPGARWRACQPPETARLLRLALALEGVDIAGWPGGLVSAAHTGDDIDATAAAFARALDRLAAAGGSAAPLPSPTGAVP